MIDVTSAPVVEPTGIGSGIALRRETADDRAFARDLYATQRAAELAGVPWDAAMKTAFVDQQFAAQSAHLRAHRPAADRWIVIRDGTPIGRMYVDRTVDPWRLVELGLLPDAAGHGVGTALMTWLTSAAETTRAGAIDLHVAIDNDRGAAFYTRLGFVEAPSDFASHRRMIRTIRVS